MVIVCKCIDCALDPYQYMSQSLEFCQCGLCIPEKIEHITTPPMKFNIIVAVDDKFGIGKSGTIPWMKTPAGHADMKMFKKITSECVDGNLPVIIMGTTTYKSCGDLPNRIMAIVGRSSQFKSVYEAIKEYQGHPIWICGGRNIYLEALSLSPAKIYLTKIPGDYSCDVFIEELVAATNDMISVNTMSSTQASLSEPEFLLYSRNVSNE